MIGPKQITTETMRKYASNPMEFFADAVVPIGNGEARLGDAWSDFQVEAFRVLGECLSAVAAGRKPKYRGAWIERTKGASKDSDVGLTILWLLLFSRRPQLVEMGADDFGQIAETRKAQQDIIRLNPWIDAWLEVQTARIVCKPTGSECVYLTRESKGGGHGSRPNATLINELSHLSSETFALTIFDNADKLPGNFLIVATNAGELKTWQHRWRELYRTNPAWYFQKVATPAPWIDPAKVADAQRRNPPSRFRRLWEGTWVSPGGDALPSDSIERAILHDKALPEYGVEDYNFSAIGVDAGLTGHHCGIVVVVGEYFSQRLRVAKVIDMAPPIRLEAVRDQIIQLARLYRANFIAVDPWQMIRVAEELTHLGFHVTAAHLTGQVLTRQAAALLEAVRDGVLELYKGDVGSDLLIEDLYSVRVVEKSYGHKLEWPENENGHCDRGAALAGVLPFAVEALGRVPCDDIDDEPTILYT